MKTYTVEEFQNDFDNMMNRVEKGEHIRIVNEEGNAAVMVPVDDELIQIYTDLNNEAP